MSSDTMDRRAVPDEATALLTIKIGEVTRTSRKLLALMSFPFLLSEGLDVFRAKVDSCAAKALENHRGEPHVREDPALYMRPGAHSKQAELVEITHNNFESRVARSYKNYLKRKTDDPFQCEVYVYVRKVAAPLRRRRQKVEVLATAMPGQVSLHGDFGQTQRLDPSELMDRPAVSARDLSAGVKRKRSLGDEGDQQQTHRTLQIQPIDDGSFRTVRMVVNGAVVPVQVNVPDLLACLGAVFQQHAAAGEDVLRNGATGADDLH